MAKMYADVQVKEEASSNSNWSAESEKLTDAMMSELKDRREKLFRRKENLNAELHDVVSAIEHLTYHIQDGGTVAESNGR